MKPVLLSCIFFGAFFCARSQSQEQRIKNFFAGFEKKDWDMVANQVTDDFNFTSPNDDNHINLKQYKDKCWATGTKYFKKIEFTRIMAEGNDAFVMYNITTTDNKIVHNVEYYTFRNGKIKSIETFFGTGVHYPGNSAEAK